MSNIFEPYDYCGECEHLSPKESEQTQDKEAHFCKKYKQRLFHLGRHPKIVRAVRCELKYGLSEEIEP